MVLRGQLGNTVQQLAGMGTKDYGYFAGGTPGAKSKVERIDYSNDTATAVAKGPLSSPRKYITGIGNQSYGYCAAGQDSSNNYTSTVDRIDYSSDTDTAVAKGPLSGATSRKYGAGNANYGYWGGGYPSPSWTNYVSTVDRQDYSTDTTACVTKGPLSAAKYGGNATGNRAFGYFYGGGQSSTTVDRIDYSNDTATASPRGGLNQGMSGQDTRTCSAVSATENALPISNNILTVSKFLGTDYGYTFGGYKIGRAHV